MFDNENIKEIRKIRIEISARFDHNPKRFIEYYKEKQKTKIKSNIHHSVITQNLVADIGK